MRLGGVRIKKGFPDTISYKIFETYSSFHEKQGTTGKVELLFFGTFSPVQAKFLFWLGGWALGYHSMKFRYFPNIS